jgi:hypothetical protein
MMKLLPRGRKQWLCLGLRFGVLFGLLAGAAGMMTVMPGRSYSGPFAGLSDDERVIRGNISRHVSMLAGSIGERNMAKYSQLQASADYIKACFEAEGYTPEAQQFDAGGKAAHNIEAQISGYDGRGDSLIVGAHYDSACGSPGANDNATGVAALLELARLLRAQRPGAQIRFVAFTNEEPPHFQTEAMGSRRYAEMASRRQESIRGMLALETIGYYSDLPGSQNYPFGFSLFYPGRGNFIGFVGNLQSRDFLRKSIELFRKTTNFPSEGVAAPGWFAGVGWSDHWSFWKQGIPAIMITDTALFRYRYYHSAGDTSDRIDYDGTARVVSGLSRVIVELAR